MIQTIVLGFFFIYLDQKKFIPQRLIFKMGPIVWRHCSISIMTTELIAEKSV